jgi:hypothetical protein
MNNEKQIKISELQKGQHIDLYLKNGEIITGIFQFIDGDEFEGDIVLKPIKTDSQSPMLGWKIRVISKIYLENENN